MEKLEKVDLILSEISVKGDDVFRMAEARKMLNEIYSELKGGDK